MYKGQHLEQLDSDLLEQLKLIVCKIVQLWEEYGYDAMSLEAKTKIRQIALQFPDTMRYYYHQLASSEILTLGSLSIKALSCLEYSNPI